MITVHHLNQSRSQRIIWLLEELGLDYQVKQYSRDAETSLAPESLRQIHPLGKSPVIDDDGRVVAETGTIIEYVINRHGGGRMRPEAGSDAEIDYLYWMHFAEGTMMPPMVMALVLGRLTEAKVPFFAKPVVKKVEAQLRAVMVDRHLPAQFKLVENHLVGQNFLAGDSLTGADIMMSFPLEAAVIRTGIGADHPNIAAYVKRIHDRPAYRAALAKGGPYDFGPQDSAG